MRASSLVSVMRTVGVAIVLTAVLAPAVRAQDAADVKRLTILTFSAPVRLPGMTLPAGKYRFEMADINNAAHTVRVLNEAGTKVIGTFSTIPTTLATRDLRNTDTLVMWAERPAGQPQAAKEWYYPQRSSGEEFVYPKAEALALAAANHLSVPAEDNGKIVRVESDESRETTAAAAPAPVESRETRIAENTTPAPVPAAEPAPAAVGTSGQSEPARARRRLPRTASQLGLFELLSGLSIAAAFGVRRLRVRVTARA
jgi:hypothetical protein